MFRPRTYSDYLKVSTLEIQSKGCLKVVSQYVFADDERANILFTRLFAEYYHPFIHLCFGLEFEQPAIVAEALAQTAIHPTFLDNFFIEIDEVASWWAPDSDHLLNIMDKIGAETKLCNAAVERRSQRSRRHPGQSEGGDDQIREGVADRSQASRGGNDRDR